MTASTLDGPMLSVAVITYNHARWIRQCFEGIDLQQVSVPFEVCIGDDGSSDGTTALCAEYAAQPHRGYTVIHQVRDRQDPARRQYDAVFMPNAMETLRACRGKYVAIIEGDDFWTDPTKLESQVSFLNEHPQHSMVIHNATLAWDPPKEDLRLCVDEVKHPDFQSDCDYSVLDWPRVPFPSCSVVVRREIVQTLVEGELAFGPMWDSPLLFIAGSQGLIRYMVHPMGCYRIHAGGCWNGPLAGDRYEVIMRLAARLLRHLRNATPDVRQWLQTLFDYNYGCVASRSHSSEDFQRRISKAFPGGTDDLHLNAWLARSSTEAILNRVDEVRRLRESTSYRLGNGFVELVRMPMRGLAWLRRTTLG